MAGLLRMGYLGRASKGFSANYLNSCELCSQCIAMTIRPDVFCIVAAIHFVL